MENTAKVTINVCHNVSAEGDKFVVEWRKMTFFVNVNQIEIVKKVAFNPAMITDEFRSKGVENRLVFRELEPLDTTQQ